jgi:hypothetical protein
MAIGDPSTADHVLVYVPGMTHSLELARYGVWRADALYEAAQAQARADETVAVVHWLGYHPPAGLRRSGPPRVAPRGICTTRCAGCGRSAARRCT